MSASYTLIVGAAPVPAREAVYRRIVGDAPCVVAADGGLAVCRAAGRLPDVVIGDFDSVDARTLEDAREAGVRVIRHPVEKDESDLDLALRYARDAGAAAVRLTAAFSGRLDHTLAALGTLLRGVDLAARLEEPGMDGYALDASYQPVLALPMRAGQVLSVFALDACSVVSIRGVHYPLTERPLQALSSLGLSNVALGGGTTVTVHSGSVVVLVAT